MEETPGYSQKFEQKSAPREKKSLEIDWILPKRKICNLPPSKILIKIYMRGFLGENLSSMYYQKILCI